MGLEKYLGYLGISKKPKETYVEFQKKIIDNVKQPRGDSVVRSDGWMNILTGAGICGRDKKQNAIYRIDRILGYAQLDQMYRADGLLRNIIDIFAYEMVRQGWVIEGDAEGKMVNKLKELRTVEAVTNLIKWSRLYGGSICIVGIADGQPLDQPVDEKAIRDVQWLRVFDRYQAYSRDGTFESDLNSPNYGYPNVYTVNDNRTGAVFYVHYSRVLRMDWNTLPPRWQNFNQGWGDPLAQSIYEELRNYSMAFSNSATIMEDFVNAILQIPDLNQIVASQCGENTIMKRLNIMALTRSNASMAVIDGNETYDKVTTNVSGIADLIDRFMYALSAVVKIPVSLLFGRSAAGMNSTGEFDMRNFYDAVKHEQETKLRQCLEKLIRYVMLSKDGPFLGVEPENWSLEFMPLWQNTEEQDAIVRKITAETDSLYIDRGVLDPAEVAISRFSGNKWSMNTEIDIESREKMVQDPEAIQELEREKEAAYTQQPTEGPDFMQTGLGRGIYTRVGI